jgi:cysteine desulfurase
MLANNETGAIQPVAEVAQACRDRGIHFHCDAVQAVGKIDVDVKALSVDSLSVAAHKLHAPKGIGALFVRQGLVLERHLFGGSQERRRRAGTENVPLAVAFGKAAELATDLSTMQRISELRDTLERELLASDFPIAINGAAARRLPNTSSVTFQGADAEGIVIGLDLQGVAVSTGSACSSGRVEPSHVLRAMGLSDDGARSTVRLSLSRMTTSAEIGRVLAVLKEVVPRCARVGTRDS